MQENNVMDWYMNVVRQYTVFTGRASRQQFWMFQLINLGIFIAISVISGIIGLDILSSLYSLAIFLPSLGVLMRRLHDTNRSGWWSLIVLIPVLGLIGIIVLTVQEGTPGANQYGDPVPAPVL